MNVNSIFLDADSMQASGGTYGIASTMCGQPKYSRFTTKYLNKVMLLDEVQNRLNAAAQTMAELPPDADRVAATTAWQVLNELYNDIKNT